MDVLLKVLVKPVSYTHLDVYKRQLYYKTLWSNIKRVWKYVGIIYSQKRRKDELDFLSKVRIFIKSYWTDLINADKMNTEDVYKRQTIIKS